MALTTQQETDLLQMLNQWETAKPLLRRDRRLLHKLLRVALKRGVIDSATMNGLLTLHQQIGPDPTELQSLNLGDDEE